MELISKLIGIQRTTYRHVNSKQKPIHSDVVEIDEASDIKYHIQRLLFDDNFDSVLCWYKNEMYVLEALERASRSYTKFKVTYHPLQEQVKIGNIHGDTPPTPPPPSNITH